MEVLKLDNIDRYIENIMSNNISEHINFEHTIKNALTANKIKTYKRNNLLKKIAVIIISITTISGVVFAKQFSEKFSNFFKDKFASNNNEYAQILNNNSKTIDGLTIKVESIYIDDFNMELVIDYTYESDISLVDSKIVIKDEENNLIFENDDFGVVNSFTNTDVNKVIKRYENRFDNESITDDREIVEYQYTTRYKSSYLRIDSNRVKRVLKLYSRENKKFPESKKLYIQLEDFILKNNSNTFKNINKKSVFEIELSNTFFNRETNKYIQNKMDSEQGFTIINAEASNVQLRLKMEYSGKQDLRQLIDTKELNCIKIFDEENNICFIADNLYIFNNKILDLYYSIDINKLSDNLIVIINNSIKIHIRKVESSF